VARRSLEGRPVAQAACPICARPVPAPTPEAIENPKEAGHLHTRVPPSADPRKSSYPFCSARCRAIDLGRWLSETYRIPGESVEQEDELAHAGAGRPKEDPES